MTDDNHNSTQDRENSSPGGVRDEEFSELVREQMDHVVRELAAHERPPEVHDVDVLRARETARQMVHDQYDRDLQPGDANALVKLLKADNVDERVEAFSEYIGVEGGETA